MKPGPVSRRYSLVSLFITINLIVLALPIIGIAALRIFENVLHRQTESKLIAEGAYVRTLYLSTLREMLDGETMGEPLVRLVEHDSPQPEGPWRPIPPTIDLWRDQVLPPGPDGVPSEQPVHHVAAEAGEMIQPMLKEAQRYNLSGVRVLDVNGTVVASTGSQMGENLSNRYEVREALEGRYCSVLRRRVVSKQHLPLDSISRASRIRIYVAIPMLEGERLAGIVYLHRTSLTFLRDLWETRFASVLIAMFSITILFSLLLAYLVTRPLRAMIRQAELIAEGEPDFNLEVGWSAPAEAHQLNRALRAMVERLRTRMDYVREFTRNVSHEFKTPLTSIQGAIELLNEGWEDMSESDRKRFLAIVSSEVRRMDNLVKRLLELTRIETTEHQYARTDLAELLQHLVHRYAEEGQKLELVREVEHAHARISTDMAEILFTNLIDNALTHGKGASVRIVISPGPRVMVADKGPGISEGNLPKIFERFFTTSRESGGTGLGLSMVKAIVKAFDAEISVTSSGEGTSFTVEFESVSGEAGHEK